MASCLDTRVISTGVSKVESFFQWRIENFSLVATHEELLTCQSFKFEIGLDPTWNWEVSLKSTNTTATEEEVEEKWIGICFARTSATDKYIASHFQILIRKAEPGENIFLDSRIVTPREDSASKSFTFSKVLKVKDIPDLKLVDGYLKVEMRVSLLSLNATRVATSTFDLHSSHRKLVSDLLPSWVKTEAKAVERTYPDDVILLPKGDDGRGMLASKSILSARSAEFANIFDHDNPKKDEVNVKVSALTRSACHALLTFAYTGRVPPEEVDTAPKIIDVARAARKFGFSELHSYCDQLLGWKCTMSNAIFLLRSAMEFELSTAAEHIMEYVKVHSGRTCSERNEKPDDRMPHNYSFQEIATTGMRQEAAHFTWRIENFDDVRKHKDFVDKQVVEHEVGFSFDAKAKWKLYLTYSKRKSGEGNFKIWIRYQLQSGLPPNSQHIFSRLLATSEESESSNGNNEESGVDDVDISTNGVSLSKLNRIGYCVCELDTKLPLVDKALLLSIRIEVYSRITEEGPRRCSGTVHANFEAESREKLLKDMHTLYKTKTKYNDVTIFTKEGHQLQAHWSILAARSPVFKAMFLSNMDEKQDGTIHLGDISSSTMELVLCYLYTGKLDDISDWNQILELIYTAEKYNLEELLNYFDSTLAAHTNLDNARELLAAAKKFRLHTAAADISEFVRRKVSISLETAELFLDLAEVE